MTDGAPMDHAELEELAKAEGRSMGSLVALSPQNDPYYAGMASRRQAAEWFANVYSTLLGSRRGLHTRRIHYVLVSQDPPIMDDTGKPYENTEQCWARLVCATRDARYLGLIPAGALVDRRNPEARIFLNGKQAEEAEIKTEIAYGVYVREHEVVNGLSDIPSLRLERPVIPQRYHVEIWIEKSTMLDVLLPLAEEYHLNVVLFSGESSNIGCEALIDRIRSSGKPCRILYVSDFDPGGMSMPLAAARKIEFHARDDDDLDIQVRPVVLTHDQCVEYRLPRTPLKETERRGARFEARFGEGGTELDALEALHPGELANILTEEIERYYDSDLSDQLETVADEAEEAVDAVNREVRERYKSEIAEFQAEIDAINANAREFARRRRERERELAERMRPFLQKMQQELEDKAPVASEFDWPEPCEGDEDDDPLFDNQRTYVEQIDRYRKHQGKEELK
jgi:hypothetical protein